MQSNFTWARVKLKYIFRSTKVTVIVIILLPNTLKWTKDIKRQSLFLTLFRNVTKSHILKNKKLEVSVSIHVVYQNLAM